MTWAAWWFFNDDRYLNLKSRIRAREAETGNADIFMGDNSGASLVTRVPGAKIRERVIPTLRLGVKDPYFDARAAASIALGKCGTGAVLADIKSTLADRDKVVRESACLAMGLLGSHDAIPLLIDIMNDTQKGRRQLNRQKEILFRTRAFAALAIGLIGARVDISDGPAIAALLKNLHAPHKTRDLSVAPLVALGTMKARGAIPALLSFVGDTANDAWSRAYACVALGKIGDRSAIALLGAALSDKQASVAQSAAIALGILLSPRDATELAMLRRTARLAPNRATRNFAIIALGEIGGLQNRDILLKLLRSKNTFDTTYAAIALGVYSHKNNDPEESVIATIIKGKFEKERNPEALGAYAVSLGLMQYRPAGPLLLKSLSKGGRPALRGHLCTALGLMDYQPAIKMVQEVVRERGDINLRRGAAIALGLMGDKEATEVLKNEIERSSNSLAVHGAVTQGLGFIGDISAVPTLTEMVKDRSLYKDVTRSFAAVALGLLGDKDDVPMLSLIAQDNNYLIRTDSIAEMLTIL